MHQGTKAVPLGSRLSIFMHVENVCSPSGGCLPPFSMVFRKTLGVRLNSPPFISSNAVRIIAEAPNALVDDAIEVECLVIADLAGSTSKMGLRRC